MSDSPIRQAYLEQKAPANALPLALEKFAAAPRVRRAYWLPPLAGALLVLVWFAAPMREVALPQHSTGEPAAGLTATPGLGAVRLPSPPTMPTLAALRLPEGDLVIPRINQISMTANPPERK